MVGWSLPTCFLASNQCNAHARSRISQGAQKCEDPPALAGRSWEGAPSLRLDFVDLPLVQGDQEGSKRLRPKSRVGRMSLVGWDPPRTTAYVPLSLCNARARFLQILIKERAEGRLFPRQGAPGPLSAENRVLSTRSRWVLCKIYFIEAGGGRCAPRLSPKGARGEAS